MEEMTISDVDGDFSDVKPVFSDVKPKKSEDVIVCSQYRKDIPLMGLVAVLISLFCEEK